MQVEATAKSVLGLYQRAIASADLLPSDKEDLSARACTFADMCGSAAMQEAAERLHAARSDPRPHHCFLPRHWPHPTRFTASRRPMPAGCLIYQGGRNAEDACVCMALLSWIENNCRFNMVDSSEDGSFVFLLVNVELWLTLARRMQDQVDC